MSTSFITSCMAVAPGIPATFDKAGFEALTFTEVEGGQVLPTSGWTTSLIEVPDLKTGITRAIKGASTGRQTSMAFREVVADPGQVLVKEYAGPAYGDEVTVRITKPASKNEVEYMSGLMSDFVGNEPSTTSSEGFTANFRQNYDALVTTPV